MNAVLSIANLSFSYPGVPALALENVSFQVEEGVFLGLVGPNGAGKSTLMSLIASLHAPTEGSLHYFGEAKPTGTQRNYVALAPQEIAVYPTLTAWENLKLFARLGRVPAREINERIEWCLEFVGLTDQRNTLALQYSGGMKRRLNLAVALVTKPKILELDEPTVGVDPQSRQLILSALKQLNEQGTTILYSSHYLEEIERYCKHLVLLDRGKVVFDGNLNEFHRTNVGLTSLEQRFMDVTGSALRD